MFFHSSLIIIALILLALAADWLVKGSVAIAMRFKLPPLIIGITLVGFGTSSPELVVSIHSALHHQGDLSIGNVIGSNIFNIGFILGLTALILPISVAHSLVRKDMPILLLSCLLMGIFFWQHQIDFFAGLLLVIGLILYIIHSLYVAKSKEVATQAISVPVSKRQSSSLIINIGQMLIGLLGLIAATQLLIPHSVALARMFGVSEAIIGLTIIAAGTSFPELATSVIAAIRGQSDVAIGNVIGSNIFNILGILGISAMVNPLRIVHINWIDFSVMIGFSLLLLPLMRSDYRLSRLEGSIFLISYLTYLGYLISQAL